jgi:hypothetical protein
MASFIITGQQKIEKESLSDKLFLVQANVQSCKECKYKKEFHWKG